MLSVEKWRECRGQNILFLEYGKAWVVDVKTAQEDVTLLQGRDSRIACNCKNTTQNIDQPINSIKEILFDL